MLISFTSKYLLEKEEAKIDELLEILIARKWERTVESLFYIIKKDKDFVGENLQIVDGDEIFAIITMAKY